MSLLATGPGRVNLIGDHTDYCGGLVLPMAIDLATTVHGVRGGDVVSLRSADESGPAIVALDGTLLDGSGWAAMVAGVVGMVAPTTGLVGEVRTTLPLGSGLSSSTALQVAVAVALDPSLLTDRPGLAARLQAAEQASTGVPCGIMDQMASLCGVAGHALVLDCTSGVATPVPVPSSAAVVVVHSGEHRQLVGSAYADRRAQCEAAARVVGPLPSAPLSSLAMVDDPVARRRARHVITEHARVAAAGVALGSGDLVRFGALMDESHASLAADFEVSTPALDSLVAALRAVPGVYGARLTGAGFGGCAVALVSVEAAADVAARFGGWVVRAAAGASAG